MILKKAVGGLCLPFLITLLAVAVPMGMPAPLASTSSLRHGVDIPQQTILSAAGGEPPLITNINEYGRFDNFSGDLPVSFASSASGDIHANFSYTGNVIEGSYSALLEVASTASTAMGYLRQTFTYNTIFLTSALNLSVSYYLNDFDSSDIWASAWVQIVFYDDSSSYYLNYVLFTTTSWLWSNTSTSAVYMLNSTVGQWHSLGRDIVQDFTEWFGAPSSATYMTRFDLYLRSTRRTPVYRGVFDNVTLYNSTHPNLLTNGGFESGSTGWYSNSVSPAYISPTTERVQGPYALNLTTRWIRPGVGYAQVTKYHTNQRALVAYEPGMLVARWYWWYDDVYNGGGQAGFAIFEVFNGSLTYYINLIMGIDQDELSIYNNNTNNYYIPVAGFGQRQTWQYAEYDLYDLFSGLNLTNARLTRYSFYISGGSNTNSSVTLLIDDFEMRTYPCMDYSFEVDWMSWADSEVALWSTTSGDDTTNTLSTIAHSGVYSYNATPAPTQTTGIYREMYVRITEAMYTDFWYYLEPPSSDSFYADISLMNDDSREIHYIVSASGVSLMNSTYDVFFIINSTEYGSWVNVVRNVHNDFVAAFGTPPTLLTDVYITVTAGPSTHTVLFDDIGFVVDTTPPSLLGTSLDPVSPSYADPVVVSVQASDLGAWDATLYYRVDGGAWTNSPMTQSGSEMASAMIPAHSYGSVVEYYFVLTDSVGNDVTEDNGGNYYSYTVDDPVPPEIEITAPFNATMAEGNFTIEVTVTDPGTGSSGVAFVEYWMDGSLVANESLSPFSATVDSRQLPNGTYVLTARAVDYAGNVATDEITVFVDNDKVPPVIMGIYLNPTDPQYGQPTTVMVEVSDDSDITSVMFHYRLNGGEWEAMPMSSTGGSLYMVTLPGYEFDTTVEYYVEATDVFGQSSSTGSADSPMFYVVGDEVSPVLLVAGPAPSDELAGIANFTISATDEGSGVAQVAVYVDGDQVFTSISFPCVFSWDTTSVDNGNHTIRVEVHDWAGNEAVFEATYIVNNPAPGLGSLLAGLSSVVAQYGVLIGFGLAVAVYGIGKFVILRRLKKSGKS